MKKLLVIALIVFLAILGAGFSGGGDSAQAANSPDVCQSPSPVCGGAQTCSATLDVYQQRDGFPCGYNNWHYAVVSTFGCCTIGGSYVRFVSRGPGVLHQTDLSNRYIWADRSYQRFTVSNLDEGWIRYYVFLST